MAARRIAQGCKVLVVEDETTIALMIEETLVHLGIQVIGPASHLDEALRLASEVPFDAAILDVDIRGGHSYPVADILAERGIPFIFCSGFNEQALEERHRDRPRLKKPYSLREFEDQVIQLLGVLSV